MLADALVLGSFYSVPVHECLNSPTYDSNTTRLCPNALFLLQPLGMAAFCVSLSSTNTTQPSTVNHTHLLPLWLDKTARARFA